MNGAPLAGSLAVPRHPEGDAASARESAAYKQLFRTFASGVAVVTADGALGPVGMTVSSVMAVSLTPPLLLVSLARASGTLVGVREAGRFAVNLLREDQQQLAARFASPRPAWVKFAGVTLVDEPAAPPLLGCALATVVCDVVWAHPAGDHTLVLGRIVRSDLVGGRPLAWHASAYHGVHPRSAR
ncbi:MAG: flavin reductase family protein [Dermatophilaceae bacterium]